MASLGDVDRLQALRQTALGPVADEALDRYARLVQRQLGVPVALVSLVDDERQFFPGQIGLPLPWSEAREAPLSHSFCRHVVTSATPLVISDTRTDDRSRGNPAIDELAALAYAGVPLTDAAGNVLGSLCAMDHEPRTWRPEDLAVLTDLAAACSSELRLRISMLSGRAALSRLALLGEVTRAVGTTLDAEDAIERLVRLVVPALGDWATAGLVDETGRTRLARGKHRDSELTRAMTAFTQLQAQALDPGAPARVVLRTAEPLVLAGAELGELLADQQSTAGLIQARSVLVVPLRARDGALGYLILGRDGEPFGETEIHDALDIGRGTGLALDNAELFRQQRSNAEALQRHLLTPLPEPDHLHLVARYLPAGQSAQVGGDWYDAFLQPDGASMLVVGDVTGHDIEAAATMGQVRNLLRGTAYDRDEAPAAILSRVDRSLRGLQVDTLATVVLARIEQTGIGQARGLRTLRWSNAGHPPPVHLAADGTVTLLDPPGELLLGLDPDTERTDHEIVLRPGDTVLLYTDGLVERRDSPLDRGLARLRQAIGALTGVPLETLCDELVARLLPQGAEDDVALVAVRAFDEQAPRPPEAGPERVPPVLDSPAVTDHGP